jgi:single-strand DNA-binding protein
MYQHLTIIGNLGRDPEMRYTPSGTPVTQLSVATNRTYKDNNGQQVKETCWFRVSVFGKTAENVAQYLHKGSLVLVEGRLTPDKQTGNPRIWDKQDGTKAASFDVFATNVRFMPSGQRAEAVPPVTDEDLAGAPSETMGGEEAIPF